MNPAQPALIKAALLHMSESAELIADTDPEGRKLAAQLEEITRKSGRGFRHHEPPDDGTDWNDHLRPREPQLPIPQP